MVETYIDYSNKFLEALNYLKSTYKKFPKFMIEIIAEENGIPNNEVKKLINTYTKNGILKIQRSEGFYYQLND
jgi:DNA-binding IscR family transcriptional regulator